MPTRLRLKAITVDGGFALRPSDDGDLGQALAKALGDVESVEVEMEDGRLLPLYNALVAMINSRVTGFIVETEKVTAEQLTSERSEDKGEYRSPPSWVDCC